MIGASIAALTVGVKAGSIPKIIAVANIHTIIFFAFIFLTPLYFINTISISVYSIAFQIPVSVGGIKKTQKNAPQGNAQCNANRIVPLIIT
jgi:hypothetical protein